MEGISEWVGRVNKEAQKIRYAGLSDDTNSRCKCSIYRLPARVINLNKEAYLPKWVSFGPYHHGEEHLKAMEEHKNRALLYILKRSNQNLECFVRAVEEVADDLLDSYQSIDLYWRENRDAFIKLMILDGCFLLEILRKESFRLDYPPSDPVFSMDYPPSDPVFGKHGDHHFLPYIRGDVFMLENQLPLLLLEKLAAAHAQDGVKYVHNLILKFFSSGQIPVSVVDGSLHMLHLYKRIFFWEPNQRAPSSGLPVTGYVGSATELNRAGITIRSSNTFGLNEISFSNGVLKLPRLIIDDLSESLFLNLLAFERFHVGAGNQVTSYIKFMSSIIQDVSDVSIVKRIIINTMGSDTTTVQLLTSVSKDLAFDPDDDLYGKVITDLFEYTISLWPSLRSSLIDTYIREWPVISAAAAALIFVLTITQTVYTVYSVYHK